MQCKSAVGDGDGSALSGGKNDMVITFSETIVVNYGTQDASTFRIEDQSGSTVLTWSDCSEIATCNFYAADNVLRIKLDNAMYVAGNIYTVVIAAGVITDLAGNSFPGLSGTGCMFQISETQAPTAAPTDPTMGKHLTAPRGFGLLCACSSHRALCSTNQSADQSADIPSMR